MLANVLILAEGGCGLARDEDDFPTLSAQPVSSSSKRHTGTPLGGAERWIAPATCCPERSRCSSSRPSALATCTAGGSPSASNDLPLIHISEPTRLLSNS